MAASTVSARLDLDSFSLLSPPDQLAAMRAFAEARPPLAPPALGEVASWFALDQLSLPIDPARVSVDRLSAAFEAVFFCGLNMGLLADARTPRPARLAAVASRDGQRTTDSLALAVIRIGKCRADVAHVTGLSRDRIDAICRDGSVVTNTERALLRRVVPTWRG